MSRILIEILILIGIAVIWSGFLFAFIWIISKTLYPLIQWLLKREWVERQIFNTSQRIQEWWGRHKSYIIGLWEFTTEILIDPIFFGFVLVLLSSRLESIINYTKTNPQNFWTVLNYDMNNDFTFYIWFIVIFTIWEIGKAWKHRQEARRDKDIINSLDRINERLGSEPRNNRDIGAINQKIRENLKRMRGYSNERNNKSK